MNKEIICIVCPLGCKMDVVVEGDDAKAVQGHHCKKGEAYAVKEACSPERVLTTTVRTDLPGVPLLPVRSNREIPKDRLMECMRMIAGHRVSGAVRCGEPVVENILGTGVDIVACRTAPYGFLPDDGH